jgi:hypothetical protein
MAVESLHVQMLMPAGSLDDIDQARVTEVAFVADVAIERRHRTLPDEPSLANSALRLHMPGADGVGKSAVVVTCRFPRLDHRTG